MCYFFGHEVHQNTIYTWPHEHGTHLPIFCPHFVYSLACPLWSEQGEKLFLLFSVKKYIFFLLCHCYGRKWKNWSWLVCAIEKRRGSAVGHHLLTQNKNYVPCLLFSLCLGKECREFSLFWKMYTFFGWSGAATTFARNCRISTTMDTLVVASREKEEKYRSTLFFVFGINI